MDRAEILAKARQIRSEASKELVVLKLDRDIAERLLDAAAELKVTKGGIVERALELWFAFRNLATRDIAIDPNGVQSRGGSIGEPSSEGAQASHGGEEDSDEHQG